MMKINYNRLNDYPNILDLKMDDFEYSKTVTVEDGVYIDFDNKGLPVAIEMISASKKFQLLERQCKGVEMEGKIVITRKWISIVIKVPQYSRIYEKETQNAYGISRGEFEFEIGSDSTFPD